MIFLLAASAHAVDFTYDALGRLRAESYANGAHILYAYDATGNRTARTVIPPNATPGSDLVTTVVLAPNPAMQGLPVTATISVQNLGPDPAPDVQIVSTLPAAFQPQRATASQGQIALAGQSVTGSLGLLAANETATIAVDGLASGTALFTVEATGSSIADANPGNNTGSASTTPGASADLALTRMFAAPDPVVAPGPLSYFVEITNLGPGNATGVTLTTTLANGLGFISGVPASGAVGQVVTTPVGALAAGAKTKVEIRTDTSSLAPGPGVFIELNTSASVIAAEGDPVSANNVSTENSQATAATRLVTTTADAGAGSLRQVILDANASPDFDVIAFNIPGGGVPTIQPVITFNAATKMPLATPMLIDGLSQPGGLVELDFSLVTSGLACLEIIGSRGIALRGLVLNRAGTFRAAVLIDDTQQGVRSSDITIQGCRIGTTADGTAAALNADGLNIFASDNILIGGSEPWQGNLISGNKNNGIIARNNTGLRIQGNKIGTNLDGDAALPNGDSSGDVGVEASLGGGLIGGENPGEGNLVSGNFNFGVKAGQGAIVRGNLIGLDASGTIALPNFIGVEVSADGIVGGFSPGARNTIAGNPINVRAATGSATAGNFIGTDATGTFGISPADIGIDAGTGSLIGLPVVSGGNLISGGTIGVRLTGGLVTIRNNRIGTDATGTIALPNALAGINLVNRDDVVIGGPGPHDGNLISGNNNPGIFANASTFSFDSASDRMIVQGNKIGTDHTGLNPLPNAVAGILFASAQNCLIGGTVPGAGNLIAFNSGIGIGIKDTSGFTATRFDSVNNRILGNSIHSNTGLGIDLGSDGGVTPNDALDADDPQDGGNRMQNFPVIVAAGSAALGTLHSAAGQTYRIEFFANAAADSSGHGEGQTFLGYLDATTDANGDAIFTFNPPTLLAAGQFLTATATDPAGNTSEFSLAREILDRPVKLPVAGPDQIERVQGQGFSVAVSALLANDSAENGGTLGFVRVNSPSSAGVTPTVVDGFLVYTVAADFNDGDTLTYIISNGEATAQGTITVIVVAAPSGPTLSIARQGAGAGNLIVSFTGVPGHTYQPQFAESLTEPIAWENLGPPLLAPSNGQIEFAAPPGGTTRFFRVIDLE